MTDENATTGESTSEERSTGDRTVETTVDERTSGDVDAGTATDRDSTDRVLYYLELGVLVVLVLFSIYALFRFYGSVSTAISLWVEREYEPLFQAAFNLAILLLAGVGISVLVRRLTRGEQA